MPDIGVTSCARHLLAIGTQGGEVDLMSYAFVALSTSDLGLFAIPFGHLNRLVKIPSRKCV